MTTTLPDTLPPAAAPPAQMQRYLDWLARERGLTFATYEDLWRWSTADLDGFWSSLWRFFDLESPTPWRAVLDAEVMPGARWFDGAQVNYARQALRHADAAAAAGVPALVFQDERMAAAGQAPVEIGWTALRRRVRAFARWLRAHGVGPGDRVAAILANTPDAVVAFLGCASVGAVWSVCSPDMGPLAVLDRFRQIEPVVLVAADGQRWGGVLHDRRAVLAQIVAGLPSLRRLLRVPVAGGALDAGALPVEDFAEASGGAAAPADGDDDDPAGDPAWLPFDHPLWIVYSSGTTGLPKALVHGHGGVLLEGLKGGVLHCDLRPSVGSGERFHWFSTTGWIMWNSQVGALLGGTTACLYDGNPAGPAGAPDWGTLWRFAAAARVTWFGAGAAFHAACMKAGVEPQREGDLSALRAVGSTGSPLADEAYDWLWQRLPRPHGRPIWIVSISGGTDFAGAFVGGNPLLPVVRGQMQCRLLGAAVHAFDEAGRAVLDEVGELVCTRPMPSMPLYLLGDADGSRYRDSYFDLYPGGDGRPRAWRHGDWIRLVPHAASGSVGAVIYGRSDATINRHGVRMGTAELYRAVEAEDAVLDSLVVDLEYLGRPSFMPLFVVLREGRALDEALVQRLKRSIRAALSPRHVPDEIVAVSSIPRTLSGKKMELPVKKLLQGADPDAVFKRDAMANADAVAWFTDYARRRSAAERAAAAAPAPASPAASSTVSPSGPAAAPPQTPPSPPPRR